LDFGGSGEHQCNNISPVRRISLHGLVVAGSAPSTRKHAEAKITVQSSDATTYDQTAGPVLMEIHLNETFTGDIDGESPVRALQVRRDDQSAILVSMQRFHGRLGGRQGSFVLQGHETVEKGKIRATWVVVAGSGTDDLTGLRGEGGFEETSEKGPSEHSIIGSNDSRGQRLSPADKCHKTASGCSSTLNASASLS